MDPRYHVTEHKWGDDRKFDAVQWYDTEFNSKTYDGFAYPFGNIDFTFVPCPYSREYDCNGKLPMHLAEYIIAIGGACKENGTPNACASIGVYFSQLSQYNISRVLDMYAPTKQKAELAACMAALHQVTSIKEPEHSFVPLEWGPRPQTVVIKADSDYVVKGMTEWISTWKGNGYRNAEGSLVSNVEFFIALDHQIQTMEGNGVKVLFWHVPRSRNREADALANNAVRDEPAQKKD